MQQQSKARRSHIGRFIAVLFTIVAVISIYVGIGVWQGIDAAGYAVMGTLVGALCLLVLWLVVYAIWQVTSKGDD